LPLNVPRTQRHPCPAAKIDPTVDRLNAETAGRLGWGSREIARRTGMDDRGRPTPAGSAEQLASAGSILAEPKAHCLFKAATRFRVRTPAAGSTPDARSLNE